MARSSVTAQLEGTAEEAAAEPVLPVDGTPAPLSLAPLPSKGALTKQAILDAAIERFGRDGFRATSVADIAREADVGGTVAYAYFPNKEALFFAAVDHDAAGMIDEALSSVSDDPLVTDWRITLIFTLTAAIERHPLARRLLAGLEPEATDRVLTTPALEQLRVACAERIRLEQEQGTVRTDIDPVSIANGCVSIILSLLMSLVQLGSAAATTYGADVAAVFRAALDHPGRPAPTGVRRR